jgi:hypothetical protein
MGCASSQSWIADYPEWDIRSAGCMFVNSKQVLVGLHTPRKRSEIRVCGLGGKKELGETWYTTAIRETIEELFHVPIVPTSLYDALLCIRPTQVIYQNKEHYVCIVYKLEDLPRFLRICRRFLHSPIYPSFPTSVSQLLNSRVNVLEAEIMQLVLWPRSISYRRFRISKDIMNDLRRISET